MGFLNLTVNTSDVASELMSQGSDLAEIINDISGDLASDTDRFDDYVEEVFENLDNGGELLITALAARIEAAKGGA